MFKRIFVLTVLISLLLSLLSGFVTNDSPIQLAENETIITEDYGSVEAIYTEDFSDKRIGVCGRKRCQC